MPNFLWKTLTKQVPLSLDHPVRAQPGFPLTLRLHAINSSGAPIPSVRLDYWAANASGIYSEEQVEGTVGQDYLRGYQVWTGVDDRCSDI